MSKSSSPKSSSRSKSAPKKQTKSPASKNSLPQVIKSKLQTLPQKPGIYKFLDSQKTIIYIGKAKKLRPRVRSYFGSHPTASAWTHKLIPQIADLEFTVVDSEIEALLLESTLIKQHQPKFNIVLKDDKNFNFVKLDLTQDFPRLQTVRRRVNDQAKYFGPFTDSTKLKRTIQLLQTIFKPQTCPNIFQEVSFGKVKAVKKLKPFPCLRASIGRCLAPCKGAVSKADYHQMISKVIQFFEGKFTELEFELQAQLKTAVSHQKFEQAAKFRDQLLAIQNITTQQKMILKNQSDLDVWGTVSSKNHHIATLLQIRSGKLLDQKNFILKGAGDPNWEIFLTDFLTQTSSLPHEILFPNASFSDAFTHLLNTKFEHKISLHIPQKGSKKNLTNLATQNAQTFLQTQIASFEAEVSPETLAQNLQILLNSKTPINIIEGFDISHLGGTETVASCVRFEHVKPVPQKFLKFNLRSIQQGEIDDFKSMREVLERRLKHLQTNPKNSSPDLILIDGGKGQLSAAWKILKSFHLENQISMLGLAKRAEEIFLPHQTSPIILAKSDPILKLLQQVRDEAHRFAITHQRSKRTKSVTSTKLEDISGIGPKTRAKLLQVFGSPVQVKKASETEIAAVIGPKLARQLKQNF